MNRGLGASKAQTLDGSLTPWPREILGADRRPVDPDEFSGLVAAIYDTTLEPERWNEVIGLCRDFIGGYSASILSKDLSGGGQLYHQDGRIDPHYARLYFERYVRMDPSNVGHLFAEIDEPISTADLHDIDEFWQSRFYKEWGKPQGLVDFIITPIEKVGGWAAMFGVLRHERDGLVDEATRQRMRLIAPHIRRAVVIGKVIEQGRQQAASFAESLDGLAAGMFLVDARGRVVHANAAGRVMIGGGQALATRDGRVVSIDRNADLALSQAIAAAGGAASEVGVKGVSVSIAGRDGVNYVAHLLPLTSGARCRAGASAAAVAMLFLQRAELDTPAAPEVIAKTFALTPSELRVLVAIVQVGGVAEVADALGIGEATVKTHLHRVFAKTGTQRQADLVKLVAAYSSPLAR